MHDFSLSVVQAEEKDIPDIARVHVLSWQESYAGIVAQNYLDGLNIEQRTARWRDIFEKRNQHGGQLWIARLNGETVGFISFGPSRDGKWPNVGEIYAVYLLQKAKGTGVGHALFQKAQQEFQKMSFKRSFACVLKDNQAARNAYAKWGGQIDPDTEETVDIGAQNYIEVPVWFDLTPSSPNPEPSHEIQQL